MGFPDLGGIVFELLNAYLMSHKHAYPIDEVPSDIEEIVRILQEQSEYGHDRNRLN